jgi:hypothetical protein
VASWLPTEADQPSAPPAPTPTSRSTRIPSIYLL